MGETGYEIISGHKVGDATDEIEIKARTNVTATVFDRKATIDFLTENQSNTRNECLNRV